MRRSRRVAEPWAGLQGDTVIVAYEGRTFKIPKYSDAVMLALLRAKCPEKQSNRVEGTSTDGSARSRQLAIIALKDDLEAALNRAEAHGRRLADARALDLSGPTQLD